MAKVNVSPSNDFCPQTLFLYGTYKADGTPNFGLFCWFSYCWDGDLCVMACIGGSKLTKDIIKEKGVFSANLVTRELLELADYFGNTEGYNPDKMNIPVETVPGAVLDVPLLVKSPWSFELEVKKTIPLDDSDVFLCAIKNVAADSALLSEDESLLTLLKKIDPVCTTKSTYFSFSGERLGAWGDWKDLEA